MWQYPNMLPKLYTWGPVVKKLIEGAGKKRADT
jgi:translation initiation factor 2D